MSIKIVELKKADASALRDLNHILAQLHTDYSRHAGSLSNLRNMLNDKNTVMIVAKDGKRIVGTGTLYIVNKIRKSNGSIEEVVVDTAYRGRGLGEKITRTIITFARRKKLKKLHLTSRPDRVAANKLYLKLGFKLNPTNPYMLKL